MHYKNGREAKNGDMIVMFPYNRIPVVGILYDAVAGNDYCNGKIALTSPGDPSPNLKECLHLDDVLSVIPPDVPDRSALNPNVAPEEPDATLNGCGSIAQADGGN